VPAGLAVPPVCDWDHSAGCLTATATNNSPVRQATNEAGSLPYMYIPPGLAMRLAGNTMQALFLARVANLVILWGLLVAAILLLWDGSSALSLLGLPLAVTPMVLFIGTAIGPSGPEIGAAAAFLAFLLRLTRNAKAPAWAWSVGIAAGAVLTLARPLGLFWTMAMLLVVASLAGRAELAAVLRRAPRASALGGGILVITAVLSLGWELAIFPPARPSPSAVAGYLLPSLASVPITLLEAIGFFGWLDTRMPEEMYGVWGTALVLLVAPALLRGRLRERRTLDWLVVAVGAAIVAVSAFVLMPVGFPVQGRYVLPFFLALPLVAGEVLYRNRERVGPQILAWLAATTGTLAAIVQLVGWYANGHRYAVGADGSWLFVSGAAWSPVGGWIPWLVLAVGGSALLVVGAFAAHRKRGSSLTATLV
jgi:hypothetical protein